HDFERDVLQAFTLSVRKTHFRVVSPIWAFDSFEQRNILRQQHYVDGLWPPKGGPEQIIHAQSCLCLPETFSPLR
ncbi:hypothetical protein NO263_00355, partial [Gluconacetobacter entanii]|nr:hypothetical protein [Gluconacetobacter entanii]